MDGNNNQQNNNVVNNQPINPTQNVNPMVGNQVNNVNNNSFNQGYVEPPKKRNNVVTYIIIFLILAVAGVGGYFAGNYIYHATHNESSSD